MDDYQTCPKCKTTKYRNPAMVLMVNACGHALCESCVELLFAKGTLTFRSFNFLWVGRLSIKLSLRLWSLPGMQVSTQKEQF